MSTPMQTQEQIKKKLLIVAVSAAVGLFLVVYLALLLDWVREGNLL